MTWNQEEHDAVAHVLERTYFPCACGKSRVHLDSLELSCAIDWLKNKVPIYHMGLVGCCEILRCRHCDNMPDHCECLPGAYEPWGNDE